MYNTNNINETELVYSLLREKYPNNQIEISYNYDNKKYTIVLSDTEYIEDPEVKVDIFTRTIYGDTDSIFIEMKFNREDFVKNRQDTFKLATICGDNITNLIFNRQPICLEFEKVFQPFILLTKKRYIGKKYEDVLDPFKLKTITNSGTAVTRRDFSKMVKDCYKEIIDCMVNDMDVSKAVDIYKTYIDKLNSYEIEIDDLVTSKTLAKSYSCTLCKKKTEWIHLVCDNCHKYSPLDSTHCKNPKCKVPFKCNHKFNLVHVQLAIKMLNRKDEANINDRIPFIFIESNDKSLAKNDLGEDPMYVKKNNLKYNRSFYLESLSKTILAFFKICLNNHQSSLDDAISYTNEKFDSYGSKRLKLSDYTLVE